MTLFLVSLLFASVTLVFLILGVRKLRTGVSKTQILGIIYLLIAGFLVLQYIGYLLFGTAQILGIAANLLFYLGPTSLFAWLGWKFLKKPGASWKMNGVVSIFVAALFAWIAFMFSQIF